MFVALGGDVFRGFAIILISWFGAKVALSSSHVHHPFHFGNFASLLLTIAFGFALVTYYDSPIPGFGVSFKNPILDQSFYLARRIEVLTIEEIHHRLTEVHLTMERTRSSGVYIVHHFLILCAIILAQTEVFAVIPFGCVAGVKPARRGRSSHSSEGSVFREPYAPKRITEPKGAKRQRLRRSDANFG